MLIIIALQIKSKHAAGSAIPITKIETIHHAATRSYISSGIVINFLKKAILARICGNIVTFRILTHDN